MYLSHCDNSKAKIPCFCFLLRARGSILLQFFPFPFGCYPSSVRQKNVLQPVLNWRNSHVKNFFDGCGAFGFCSAVSLLSTQKKQRKCAFLILYELFCSVPNCMLFWYSGVVVYIVSFFMLCWFRVVLV